MKRERESETGKRTGRPRCFDESEALNKAMLAFWRDGYESTSMSVLTEAMGMSAPSIYSVFGDKKALFLKALDLYVGDLDHLRAFVNEAPSAFHAADEILKASALRFTGKLTPRGCMLASATASGSPETADLQADAAKRRAVIENILRARIEKDVTLGILPKHISASALAALTVSVIQGMSVLARDGGSQKKLLSVAQSAMAAWGSIKTPVP